jgi:hypothetical protein
MMTKKTTEKIQEKSAKKKSVKPLNQTKAAKKDKPLQKVVNEEKAEPNESNVTHAVANWRSPVKHARSTSRLKKIRSVS